MMFGGGSDMLGVASRHPEREMFAVARAAVLRNFRLLRFCIAGPLFFRQGYYKAI